MPTKKGGSQEAAPAEIWNTVDPAYGLLNNGPMTQLVQDVWSDKYRQGDETWDQMCWRVSRGVYAQDSTAEADKALIAMKLRLWMPAGRILAGAGTTKRVTMLNCFVCGQLEDDMASIATQLGNLMLTMQQGGGVGTDFTPLRPAGAILRRTGSTASGPGPFLDTWDSACVTIRSAGDRRGAMMGTLGCWHPFLPDFIQAKHTKGRWTNFNVSVLITDAFLGAVAEDEEWYLHHRAEPSFSRPPELVAKDFQDDDIDDGAHQYVYSVHKARDLWDQILRSTYEYSEPGVIFIDRMNELNNLQPWEHLQCTNPCGEQVLPPNGCCDLGAMNLSQMVTSPFTEEATFNYPLLQEVVKIGTRFLDNVIDTTNYPLPEQQHEEFTKRRIGLGVSGLADAMHQLGMRYGSPASCRFAEEVMATIAEHAYLTSTYLAEEKGEAPIFQEPGAREKLLERPFIRQLPDYVQERIKLHGLRNGVLLTVAPTGTTSIAYGNISSGLEPVFAHSMRRKVRQGDDTWAEYDEVAYGARLWMALNAHDDNLPAYMNVCADVKVHEHIRIQEACQKWVDASISKTINLPEEITYEEFKEVYTQAYESGCKGCTTYRPSDVRGSILDVADSKCDKEGSEEVPTEPQKKAALERPEIAESRTIKIKWPNLNSSLYLTVGFVDGRPFEVFLNSKDQKSLEWMMTTTILMSMALRMGTTMEELAKEFQGVSALEGGYAPNGGGKMQYWPSLISYIGHKMDLLTKEKQATDYVMEYLVQVMDKEEPIIQPRSSEEILPGQPIQGAPRMDQCPKCNQYTVTSLSGCLTCTNCGWSRCL